MVVVLLTSQRKLKQTINGHNRLIIKPLLSSKDSEGFIFVYKVKQRLQGGIKIWLMVVVFNML